MFGGEGKRNENGSHWLDDFNTDFFVSNKSVLRDQSDNANSLLRKLPLKNVNKMDERREVIKKK